MYKKWSDSQKRNHPIFLLFIIVLYIECIPYIVIYDKFLYVNKSSFFFYIFLPVKNIFRDF